MLMPEMVNAYSDILFYSLSKGLFQKQLWPECLVSSNLFPPSNHEKNPQVRKKFIFCNICLPKYLVECCYLFSMIS